MDGKWKEVVRLAFRGDRFQDHALDLTALTELRQFQKLIAETAKVLWRAAHADRRNLPAHFEDRTRLCLRRIDEGSAVAPLEVRIEEPAQDELCEREPEELFAAVELASQVFDCVERDHPLPSGFPRELIGEYSELGKSLGEGEHVELRPVSKGKPARVSPTTRERLTRLLEAPHSNVVEIRGRVLEADVRQRRFQVWIDEKTSVTVNFTEQQEDMVITALKNHRIIELVVCGLAEVSSEGKPLRVTRIDKLHVHPDGTPSFDPAAPAIEDVLAELAKSVPEEEWNRLPADLTDNLDHYLYGI